MRPALSTAAWRKLRARVKRIGVCFYCHTSVGPFEADHLVAPSQGGGELDPANVVCACLPCNRSKGSRTVAEWRASGSPLLPGARQRTVYSRRPGLPGGLFGDYTRRTP